MLFLRASAFNAWFYGLTFVMVWPGGLICLFARHRVPDYARFWIRLVLGGLRLCCGIRAEVSGRDNLPATGPALIASQHQSAFDTLIWMLLAPNTCFVLKQELLRIPIFGRLLMDAGMIAVDRRAGAAALRKLLNDVAVARDAGKQIVIFPEGTRAAFGAPIKLQPGIAAIASRLDMEVIPVATDSGRRWARNSFMKNPGPIKIKIGAPIARGTGRNDLLAALTRFYEAGAEG